MVQRAEKCGYCKGLISQPVGPGRPRKFCCTACRHRANHPAACKSTPIAYNTCAKCGDLFVTRACLARRFCSIQCCNASRALIYRCQWCGQRFVRRRGGTGKFCSTDCYHASRRATVVQLVLVSEREPVLPRERRRSQIHWTDIVERDAHRCHLCGGKVRVGGHDEYGYDPLGPSVDHLVPSILGGADVLDNVSLAHRYCNIARGAALLDAAAYG